MRMTKKHLLDDFERLKRHTELNLEIEWSGDPHRPRIFRTSKSGDMGNFSPRLTLREMHLWIEAFEDGFNYGFTSKGGD